MANYADQTRMGDIHGWYVYLLEEEGGAFCKIGTALTLGYRRASLGHGNPRPLTIVKSWHLLSRASALTVEKKALELSGSLRLPGRDWVRGSSRDVSGFIEAAVALVGGLK